MPCAARTAPDALSLYLCLCLRLTSRACKPVVIHACYHMHMIDPFPSRASPSSHRTPKLSGRRQAARPSIVGQCHECMPPKTPRNTRRLTYDASHTDPHKSSLCLGYISVRKGFCYTWTRSARLSYIPWLFLFRLRHPAFPFTLAL